LSGRRGQADCGQRDHGSHERQGVLDRAHEISSYGKIRMSNAVNVVSFIGSNPTQECGFLADTVAPPTLHRARAERHDVPRWQAELHLQRSLFHGKTALRERRRGKTTFEDIEASSTLR
jgi:hypothetical protein